MSDGIIMIGNIYYGKYRHGFAGNIVGVTGISPTITCVGGGKNRYARPSKLTTIKWEWQTLCITKAAAMVFSHLA